MNQPIQVRSGSGNVFADLELENADELLVKAELARRICGIIAAQNMTETEAAKMLGVDLPKVSANFPVLGASWLLVRLLW